MSADEGKKLPQRLGKPPDGKWIFYDADGRPHPMYTESNHSKQQVAALIYTGFSVPYKPKRSKKTGDYLQGEEQFEGMTNMEVAAIRLGQQAADGDLNAIREGMDRMIGKPKQVTENLNVSATFQEFLQVLPDPPGGVEEYANSDDYEAVDINAATMNEEGFDDEEADLDEEEEESWI